MLRTMLSPAQRRPLWPLSRHLGFNSVLQPSLVARYMHTPSRSRGAVVQRISPLSTAQRACRPALNNFSLSVSAQGPVDSHPTSFADPDRPELFYHLFQPPETNRAVFALTFLSEVPAVVDSCTILGWLPAHVEGGGQAGLNDFRENLKFIDVLHEAIERGLRDGVDEIQTNSAIQTQQGWMHIHDNRNIPALGRIGDPDDIIASVRVEGGKILPDTYQPMPSYRLCTSDGVLQLTEGLHERLKEVLAQRAREEASRRS